MLFYHWHRTVQCTPVKSRGKEDTHPVLAALEKWLFYSNMLNVRVVLNAACGPAFFRTSIWRPGAARRLCRELFPVFVTLCPSVRINCSWKQVHQLLLQDIGINIKIQELHGKSFSPYKKRITPNNVQNLFTLNKNQSNPIYILTGISLLKKVYN